MFNTTSTHQSSCFIDYIGIEDAPASPDAPLECDEDVGPADKTPLPDKIPFDISVVEESMADIASTPGATSTMSGTFLTQFSI